MKINIHMYGGHPLTIFLAGFSILVLTFSCGYSGAEGDDLFVLVIPADSTANPGIIRVIYYIILYLVWEGRRGFL